MIVTAWNNGAHHATGAGYGIRISLANCNEFDPHWASVWIRIPNHDEFEAPLAHSFFFGNCHEIRSQIIGIWLIGLGHQHWTNGNPPEFEFNQINDNIFELRDI
jgi:hypothetical protein